MEMKNFKRFFLPIMAVAMMTPFLSCSSDDDKSEDPEPVVDPVGGSNSGAENPENSLTGLWRYDWGDDPRTDYTAYYFGEKDEYYGTYSGVYFDKGNGGEQFEYQYDKSSQTVELDYQTGGTESLKIDGLSSKSIVIDGDRYEKAELTKELILLGEWTLHVGEQSARSISRVEFLNDGSYVAVDNIDQSYGSIELSCSFNASDFRNRYVYGRYYLDDKNISFTGNSDIAGDYIIDGLVVNGMRLIRASHPDEYPYIIGEWSDR